MKLYELLLLKVMYVIPGTIVIISHQTCGPDSTSRFQRINQTERDDSGADPGGPPLDPRF